MQTSKNNASEAAKIACQQIFVFSATAPYERIDFKTIKEAVDWLGVARHTFYQALDSGEPLTREKHGIKLGQWLIDIPFTRQKRIRIRMADNYQQARLARTAAKTGKEVSQP